MATVFGGLTLAMAIGVPLSTWFGGIIAWRPVMGAIGVAGAMGIVDLAAGIRDPLAPEHKRTAASPLYALFHLSLLSAALVTVLAYAGSFTVYIYLTPLLLQKTGVSSDSVTVVMLVSGIAAGLGNFAGGRLTDTLGINRANLVIIGGIMLIVFGMWLFSESVIIMFLLSGLLGIFTFGSVPSLQARLLGVASVKAPQASSVASGLNIAGFNLGIALGSVTGGQVIIHAGSGSRGLAGSLLALAGILLLGFQSRSANAIVAGTKAL